MKIPKILFGIGKEVHRPVGRWMTKVKRDRQWPLLPEVEFVDTTETVPPGSPERVIFDIDPQIGMQNHFRVYSPARYFKFACDMEPFQEELKLFYDGLVESTWGLLCLLPYGSYIPSLEVDRDRCVRFFERLNEDWDLFLDERHLFEHVRFSERTGTYFWNETYTKLFPALVRAGVPENVVGNTDLKTADDYQVPRWIEEYIL
ncbi:MAG: hypothetical protein AAF998_00435 [Bacteroidota bacterium]